MICSDATLSCVYKNKKKHFWQSKLASHIDWQLEKYSALHPLWGPIHLPNECDNNYIGIYWINYCISERRKCSEGMFFVAKWNDSNLRGYFTYWIASLFSVCFLPLSFTFPGRLFIYLKWHGISIPALREVNWGRILKAKQLGGQQ